METTEYETTAKSLVAQAQLLPSEKRSLFLLGCAQRYQRLFALYERQLKVLSRPFADVLEKLWLMAAGTEPQESLEAVVSGMLPEEEWVVDGFHDAIAQYVGGLAVGASQAMGRGEVDGLPEWGVFDALRLLLCEMRLGCSEPGETPEGLRFEAELHNEPLVAGETGFLRLLLGMIDQGSSVEELRTLAHPLDPAVLEPDLTKGLEMDRLAADY